MASSLKRQVRQINVEEYDRVSRARDRSFVQARAVLRPELLRAHRRYETPEVLQMPTRTNLFLERKSGGVT